MNVFTEDKNEIDKKCSEFSSNETKTEILNVDVVTQNMEVSQHVNTEMMKSLKMNSETENHVTLTSLTDNTNYTIHEVAQVETSNLENNDMDNNFLTRKNGPEQLVNELIK